MPGSPSSDRSPSVLFASSELAPWLKTGGLADVAAALPPALATRGCEVRVVVPLHGALRHALGEGPLRVVADLPEPGAAVVEWPSTVPGLSYLAVAASLFDREGDPYRGPDGEDWPDNADRYGFFCRALSHLAEGALGAWRPDVVHLNDWQTGLAAPLLRGSVPTVFSIHNLSYQGLFDRGAFERLGLPEAWWSLDGVEFHGRLSFLKAGIVAADAITTVSPSYAEEIRTPEHGCGLDGLLRHRSGALRGILNGIDTAVWDPERDPHLATPFGAGDLSGKAVARARLRERLGLLEEPAPVLGSVGRLAGQKGVDLLLAVIDDVVRLPAQLAVLGSGEAPLAEALHAAARRHPGRVAFVEGFDEGLAHGIEAGADLFLMPSRFEPCGLNQMYSMRYGTIPVVRATGGLRDTVVPQEAFPLAGTGFVFREATPEAFLAAIARAVAAWERPELRRSLQRNGMHLDFSWSRSAAEYVRLYRSLPASPGPGGEVAR